MQVNSASFLRQLSVGSGSGPEVSWGNYDDYNYNYNSSSSSNYYDSCSYTTTTTTTATAASVTNQMEEELAAGRLQGHCYSGGSGLVMRKRVMVVVDQGSHSKHAMIWALTHVVNKADLLTLLHIIPPSQGPQSSHSSSLLANSLGSLCKACKPEVEVEALVVQGPKFATVMSQVKKLDVSMLVLGQKKPSPLISCLCGSSRSEEFVEKCIKNLECMSVVGVRKQSKGRSGYLISTKWQKNFWLLA